MRIIYVQYADPALYPPLEHSSRFFANRGWKVLFLGIGAWGAPAIQFPEHNNITVRRMPFQGPGTLQKLHYLLYCAWVLVWMLLWRPRWAYVSDPLACPLGSLLSYIPNLGIVYHEHDAPAQQSSLIMRSRKTLANRVSLAVLPNHERVKRFCMETGRAQRVICVWNCPRQEEIAEPRQPIAANEFWVLYHGSLTSQRLPLTILEALARLPEKVKLRIIGYETIGSDGYAGQIRDTASELQISDRIEILSVVPRSDLLRYGRQSDIGLSFMPMQSDDLNMRAMTGASNKAFDYLACGQALLVSDLPDWKSFFVVPGYGVACKPDDAASIERALLPLIANPGHVRAMGESGRQRILDEWNYETQFAPVYAAMESLK